jgi:hypothetical protein
VVLLLSLAGTARANIGPEWQGAFGTSPHGGLKEIAIRRETLHLDLRPLITREPIRIEATYEVYSFGTGKTLDLVFVAGSEQVSDFEVVLGTKRHDGVVLPAHEVKQRWKEIPASWKPPNQFPHSGEERVTEGLIIPERTCR